MMKYKIPRCTLQWIVSDVFYKSYDIKAIFVVFLGLIP